MRKLIAICLVLFTVTLHAQDYKIEDGTVVVSKVVENVKANKDEIYSRVKAYFVHYYKDANAVIQTDDKEGGLIIGKGIYAKLNTFNLGAWVMDADHILRVDIKDGRVRIICSAENMKSYPPADRSNGGEYHIVDFYPVTDKRAKVAVKKAQKAAFDELILRLNASVNSLEKAIVSGGVVASEKSDW